MFFFSVKSLTLTEMGHLTITQRMKMIKTYYKNSDSATTTYRALKEDYGWINYSTTQAIGKILKKLEETGVDINEGYKWSGMMKHISYRFITLSGLLINQNVLEIQPQKKKKTKKDLMIC